MINDIYNAEGEISEHRAEQEAVEDASEVDVSLPAYIALSAKQPRRKHLKPMLCKTPYIRVVHTNGLHHLAMVCCTCRESQDGLPLDLIASRLVPTSFDRIRTLFTAQMLDYFRLCNLETKATAYQFYQLLRRITQPWAPAEVLESVQ